MALVNASVAISRKTTQRINYGVLFKHLGQVDLAEQYWQHTFEIKMPTGVVSEEVPHNLKDDDGWSTLVISTLKAEQ